MKTYQWIQGPIMKNWNLLGFIKSTCQKITFKNTLNNALFLVVRQNKGHPIYKKRRGIWKDYAWTNRETY